MLSVLAWPLGPEDLAACSGCAYLPLDALQRALLLQHQHGRVLGATGR